MCNAGVGKPRHRRAHSVAVRSPVHAPLKETRRPVSADALRKVTAPAFVPAAPNKLPRTPNELGCLKPTFFKPVVTGVQQRASTTSSGSCNGQSTLGSLRRQNGTRSLKGLAPTSRKSTTESPIKRRGAVRNLLSAARHESGQPDPLPKISQQPFRISQFLSGEPVVF
eukprot:INCI14876.1.p1 GENE.INCI14876.1~~INCI14876.1.p1  ORF type:complete len:168 (-),score=8.40 INCI14876.1:75-578(-)